MQNPKLQKFDIQVECIQDTTNSAPCSKVIQKRVMVLSVIGIKDFFFFTHSLKSSTTLPLLPSTLPYLTTENLVIPFPTKLFPATNNYRLWV